MKELSSLTKQQKAVACSAINKYGSGQHPMADSKTFDYFVPAYVKRVLKKAIEDSKGCDMASVIEKCKVAQEVLELLK